MPEKKPDPDALAADGDAVKEGVEPPTEEELAAAREVHDGNG